MNKKLQTLTDEFSREIQARLPNVQVEVWPRGRKAAFIYLIGPHERFWDDADVWDVVDELSPKEVDTLVKTGYSIRLLPHQPVQASLTGAPAFLREKGPEWEDKTKKKGVQTPK